VDAGSPCPPEGKRKEGREGGHKLIIHPFGKGLCFQIMYSWIQNSEFRILKKIPKNSGFFIFIFFGLKIKLWSHTVFFWAKFCNFLKPANMILTHTKDSCEKMALISQISKKKRLIIARFLQFPAGSQKYKNLLKFFYFHIGSIARFG